MNGSREPIPDAMNDIGGPLREALSPRPGAAERIVRNALAAEPEAVAPRWRPASVAAALVAGAALLFVWQLNRARFVPEPGPAAISIVSEGGVLIATTPSGDWLVRSVEPEPSKPGIIILSHGEEP